MTHPEDATAIARAIRLAFPEEVAPTLQPPPAPTAPWTLALQLLVAQVPVVRRTLWPASAVVMGVGFAVTLLAPRGGGGTFAALTPLIAAAGLAFVYGPENDPSLEIALATTTSPRIVLLARLGLVCGYDLALALIASAALTLLGQPAGGLEALILAWLGPMLLLSAISLAVAVRFGTAASFGTAAVIWLLHLTSGRALEHSVGRLAALDPVTVTLLTVGMALAIIGLILVRVPREFETT